MPVENADPNWAGFVPNFRDPVSPMFHVEHKRQGSVISIGLSFQACARYEPMFHVEHMMVALGTLACISAF
jgi:hypothetical protein